MSLARAEDAVKGLGVTNSQGDAGSTEGAPWL